MRTDAMAEITRHGGHNIATPREEHASIVPGTYVDY